jgi:hypothetical protein
MAARIQAARDTVAETARSCGALKTQQPLAAEQQGQEGQIGQETRQLSPHGHDNGSAGKMPSTAKPEDHEP